MSTDFGNVSQSLPGSHVYFGIGGGSRIELHTREFAEAAGSDHAFDQAMLAAGAMARVATRFFTNEPFRREVRAAFEASKKESSG